jgi:hypothetical protein
LRNQKFYNFFLIKKKKFHFFLKQMQVNKQFYGKLCLPYLSEYGFIQVSIIPNQLGMQSIVLDGVKKIIKNDLRLFLESKLRTKVYSDSRGDIVYCHGDTNNLEALLHEYIQSQPIPMDTSM